MDKLSPAHRSANMRSIRSGDTKPEMLVRRLIHAMGFRYRLHDKKLPGKPDLVFASRRKVIFVHGCFWHQHPSAKCVDARVPRSNSEYWLPKLARNEKRDEENQAALAALGWKTMIVWECEIQKNKDIGEKIREFLEG